MGNYSDGCPDSGHTGNGDCENNTTGICGDFDYEAYRNRGKGCFPSSALVETPSGKVLISKLKVGQCILSYSDGRLVERHIIRKLIYKPAQIVHVEFDDVEGSLCATLNHSFMSTNGWLPLGKLKVGDLIIQPTSRVTNARRIKKVMRIADLEPVYNLYTEYEHNFIVDGCLAHNFTNFRLIRMLFYRTFFYFSKWKLLQSQYSSVI